MDGNWIYRDSKNASSWNYDIHAKVHGNILSVSFFILILAWAREKEHGLTPWHLKAIADWLPFKENAFRRGIYMAGSRQCYW